MGRIITSYAIGCDYADRAPRRSYYCAFATDEEVPLAAYYTLLKDEGLLHITGPDTLKFLQGQTTCDTRKVDTHHALPGAFCTAKGRMVCDFLLLQLGEEHFALRMRKDTLEQSATAFSKYIVFSKAKLEASRSDWAVVACWGETSLTALQGLGMAIPAGRYQAATGAGYVLVQMDEAGSQFELYLDMQSHEAQFKALSKAMDEATETQWQALQIASGVARVEGATSGELLPQMLNYDLTGHISFNKGCYTGQEIVARLHYRGKAKRRLYLAALLGAAPLPAGTELFSEGSDQASGMVVNSAPTDNGCICLVSATEGGIATGLCAAGGDKAMDIGVLPYAVE